MNIELQIFHPPKIGLKEKQGLIFLLGFIYSVIVLIMKKPILLFFDVALIFYSNIINKYRFNPEKFLDGSLIISSDSISINDKRFLLTELSKLKININDYNGMVITDDDNNTTYYNGINNYISFKQNNKSYRYEFFISDKEKLNAFKELFHEWYINKQSFFESSGEGSRTYCLEHLNYKEIQLFKEKYK